MIAATVPVFGGMLHPSEGSGAAVMTREQEQDFIRRAIGGDRDAAEALVRRHQAPVYAYVMRLSGRHDVAEDVTQEAFVRALTHLERFDTRFRFSTWIFTIAKRVYLSGRARMSPVFDSDAVGDRNAHAITPDRGVIGTDARRVVRDAVQRVLAVLPETQREVLVLFYQHAWPIWLIGEHLGIPEGTVKSHLHRGRAKVRDALADSRAVRDSRDGWGSRLAAWIGGRAP
ncbi:MAG: sigma-70 family RNA polymerase sigma factor [Phycisphaerae bacterium]|nr:sigma-70 family RNA polymerase sigma factor [Phycisphaerae bacterium]